MFYTCELRQTQKTSQKYLEELSFWLVLFYFMGGGGGVFDCVSRLFEDSLFITERGNGISCTGIAGGVLLYIQPTAYAMHILFLKYPAYHSLWSFWYILI